MMTTNKTYWMASMCGGLLVLALSGCATHPKGQMAVRPEAEPPFPDSVPRGRRFGRTDV